MRHVRGTNLKAYRAPLRRETIHPTQRNPAKHGITAMKGSKVIDWGFPDDPPVKPKIKSSEASHAKAAERQWTKEEVVVETSFETKKNAYIARMKTLSTNPKPRGAIGDPNGPFAKQVRKAGKTLDHIKVRHGADAEKETRMTAYTKLRLGAVKEDVTKTPLPDKDAFWFKQARIHAMIRNRNERKDFIAKSLYPGRMKKIDLPRYTKEEVVQEKKKPDYAKLVKRIMRVQTKNEHTFGSAFKRRAYRFSGTKNGVTRHFTTPTGAKVFSGEETTPIKKLQPPGPLKGDEKWEKKVDPQKPIKEAVYPKGPSKPLSPELAARVKADIEKRRKANHALIKDVKKTVDVHMAGWAQSWKKDPMKENFKVGDTVEYTGRYDQKRVGVIIHKHDASSLHAGHYNVKRVGALSMKTEYPETIHGSKLKLREELVSKHDGLPIQKTTKSMTSQERGAAHRRFVSHTWAAQRERWNKWKSDRAMKSTIKDAGDAVGTGAHGTRKEEAIVEKLKPGDGKTSCKDCGEKLDATDKHRSRTTGEMFQGGRCQHCHAMNMAPDFTPIREDWTPIQHAEHAAAMSNVARNRNTLTAHKDAASAHRNAAAAYKKQPKISRSKFVDFAKIHLDHAAEHDAHALRIGKRTGVIEAVSVDTGRWDRSAQGAAGVRKGRGSWIFTKHRGGVNWDQHKEGEDHITVNDKYGEAKKKATAWAKEKGHHTIYVAEGVVNELRTTTYRRYIDKAVYKKSMADIGRGVAVGFASHQGKALGPDQAHNRRDYKRTRGISRAAELLGRTRKEETEPINELKDTTLGRYIEKADKDAKFRDKVSDSMAAMHHISKFTMKAKKRRKGIRRAYVKVTRGDYKTLAAHESVEPVAELKKTTYASYIKKAADDLRDAEGESVSSYERGQLGTSRRADRLASRRHRGIEKAADRLAK